MKKTKSIALLFISAVIALSTFPYAAVEAVTASDWKAGNIISDDVFTNRTSMSVSQIQSWLDVRLKNCDHNGTQRSELGGGRDYDGNGTVTRAEYGRTMGNPAPFTCLNRYYEVPKIVPSSKAPVSNYGKSTIPTGAKSAAQLIYDAAQAHSISPKVLLVKLATESAGPLTSDPWPFKRQYDFAMGAHCPDSGPNGTANCDSDYAGFSLQIREAAALMRWYLDNMNQSWWSYKKPYQTNYILWNVAPSNCGGSSVYISNKATAALYTYTPYQPNQSALNNMYGAGDRCGAYGNRNFWRVFNDWFGNSLSTIKYSNLKNPRDMQLISSTRKMSMTLGQPIDSTLSAGQIISFADSTVFNGKLYFRTTHDKNKGLSKGILASNIVDTPIEVNDFQAPRELQFKRNTNAYNLSNGMPDLNQEISRGQSKYFAHKSLRGDGRWYYISNEQYSSEPSIAYRASDLEDTLTYDNMMSPRSLEIKKDLYKVDLRSGKNVYSRLEAGRNISFSETYVLNGVFYLRTEHDVLNNYDRGIAYANLQELPVSYDDFQDPRALVLNNDSFKYNIKSGVAFTEVVPAGTQYYFTTKTTRSDGRLYYRTQDNTTSNVDIGFRSVDLKELP